MPPGARAITMLARTATRRHWRASLFLAVVAGIVAAIVGASFQAAARADTSLERYAERSRIYDQIAQGCPPSVDVSQLDNDFSKILRLCVNPVETARLRRVIDRMPGVERTAVMSTLAIALLDPAATNHWGRFTLLAGVRAADDAAVASRPIIVQGRLYDPAAPDEILLSEDAARVTGLHVGDGVRIAGWRQADLDAAIDGALAPQTPAFASRVVGIVRSVEDVQVSSGGSLSESIPGDFNVFTGPAWVAAHGDDLSGYGSGVLVRLRAGPQGVASFTEAFNAAPGGWHGEASDVGDVDPASVRRVIDLERKALLVFAFVALVAGLAFVGLTTMRQLRHEASEWEPLLALGMTRRGLRAVNGVRALTVAAPAGVIAAAGVVALSPLEPLGLAHKLEFAVGVRVDPAVILVTIASVLLFFVLTGVMAPVLSGASRRASARARLGTLSPAFAAIGPVALLGATVARGRSSRAAVAVTAVAVAAGIGAGGLVASYDRLVRDPKHFGASWDLVVGQYSQPGTYADGVAKLRANPAVAAAAGYFEQTDIAKIDGQRSLFVALSDLVGHRDPVMVAGRPPEIDSEVALGRATARRIHKGIGDRVTVAWHDGDAVRTASMRVVGIVVVNDPVTVKTGPGLGVLVRPRMFNKVNGIQSVAQSIVIALDPHHDRATAIESVRRDFAGSIREAVPQVDVLNLGRLRPVPGLIAGLIALLAVATLVHALLTLLGRNRTALAVLAALGFTRRQRRGVGVFASFGLVALGLVLGVPAGLVVSSRIWRAISDGIDLPSGAATAWASLGGAVLGAFGVAALVSLAALRRSGRRTPSEQLRVE